MFQIASRLVYNFRALVIVCWSISALCFFLLMRLRILAWLVVLPEWFAKVAIILAANIGIMILGCIPVGASSLILWRWFPLTLSASLVILIPILVLVGSILYARIDKMGTEQYVINSSQQGDVQNTREQLLIHMARYQLPNELQALVQVGTNVNAADPLGRSALFWTVQKPEMVRLLLQSGAKPDGNALVEAAFWGRLDTIKLLFEATPDDGKTLVAEVGDRALQNATNVRSSGQQDRQQIVQMLVARGAKPILNTNQDNLP
ncbi:ankyrin repeat domain-containing protein [Nostoc sp. LPT]|uniref:ankyrin repeat domain-containing protein n=1 Tax=Nostoc sp. LPT TaxID=2815387 RepID=UPI001D4FA9F3|nr:ankyrin repeat domain-containing protein [Nostoc sp. LPT]MBN4006311.1 ankyrin repeat domain-containing protein [Nostoc sp. LPT]